MASRGPNAARWQGQSALAEVERGLMNFDPDAQRTTGWEAQLGWGGEWEAQLQLVQGGAHGMAAGVGALGGKARSRYGA